MKPNKTRYFFEIAYNGSQYHGWQVQPNSTAVQEVFEDRLSKKIREDVRTYGCGRTDTGVHARKFFLHFESEQTFDASLGYELNAFLPRDIACKKLYKVAAHLDHYRLHARFDAYERQYEYLIALEKDPFGIGHKTVFYSQKLNLDIMHEAAALLPNYSNFRAFSKLETTGKSNECKMYWAKWEQDGNQLKFTISANRFLRSMVRKIVGTMIWLGSGRMTLDEFKAGIESQDPTKTGLVAPPDGLYLIDIKYPDNSLELIG